MTAAPKNEEHHAERKATFKRRLEAFSDIVFGVSLSQLAVLLGLPPRASDLFSNPLSYLVFFASFAIVCMFWYSHHRMFRYFYPGRIDVLLNFAYLAFTVLVPFSMRALLQFPDSPYSHALYAACFTGTSGTMCGLVLRSLRRSGATLARGEALALFRRAIRLAAVCGVMLVALAMLPLGVVIAGSVLWLLVPLMLLPRLVHGVPQRLLTNAGPKV